MSILNLGPMQTGWVCTATSSWQAQTLGLEKRSHDMRHRDLEFATEVESGKVSTHDEQGRQRMWDSGCGVRGDE
jgi:hypothetical protein